MNQRGASIIEVLIMSGAMVAMMVGFMSLMSHSAKTVTYLEDKLSRVSLENELRLHFSNPDFCEDLLSGVIAPAQGTMADLLRKLTQVTQREALKKVFQRRGNKTVYDHLELTKIILEDSDLTAPDSSGVLSLMFYLERSRKGGGPPSLQPVEITTRVSVDGSYKIKSCRAEEAGGGEGDCQSPYSESDYNRRGAEKDPKWAPGSVLPEGSYTIVSGNGTDPYVETSNQLICINGVWVPVELPPKQLNQPNGSNE